MSDFPPAIQRAAEYASDCHPGARALLEAPELCGFWQRIAEHVDVLVAQGWTRDNATTVLVGDVVLPLIVGHDAHGTFARAIRSGVNMERRRRAAELARELAAMLDAIECEPMPPEGVTTFTSLLPWWPMFRRELRSLPSSLLGERPAEMLRRLAAELEREPDFSDAPAFESRKPSWRGFVREVAANLRDYGFALREIEACRLVEVVCRVGRVRPPSRDSVRDALRSTET